MKILVTGGAGFIGSAVVRNILENTQDSVINLDKLTYAGNLESLKSVDKSERYAFEQVDICNRTELDRVFKIHMPDAVMHLAAESHVDRSITGPAEFIQTNIVGTYNLLEAAREYWNTLTDPAKNVFRFHHISTDEVYGDLPHPDEQVENSLGKELSLFTEQTAYAPSSPYSASKASSDHHLGDSVVDVQHVEDEWRGIGGENENLTLADRSGAGLAQVRQRKIGGEQTRRPLERVEELDLLVVRGGATNHECEGP